MAEPYNRLRINPDAPLPIASQLANQLRWLVASGQINANEQLPPIRELADRLGINMHTVRAAYTLLEEIGLVQVRRGRGTTVLEVDRARLAHGIPSLPTFTIGVLIPSYSSFFTPFLDAVEASAEADPLMILIGNTRDSQQLAARWLDQLLSHNVDGILIASRGLPDGLIPTEFTSAANGFPPLVFADIPNAPSPRVLLDHAKGGRLTAEHMLEHGYLEPAVITPPLEWPNVAEVYEGFAQAYAEAGQPLADSRVVVVDGFGIEPGRIGAELLLQRIGAPTSLFAAGDNLAVGAQRLLTEHDLRAPQDYGLLGYGGMQLSELVDPPLTTAVLDAAGMGATAIDLLRRRMNGEPTTDELRLPVQLKVRASCGCG